MEEDSGIQEGHGAPDITSSRPKERLSKVGEVSAKGKHNLHRMDFTAIVFP